MPRIALAPLTQWITEAAVQHGSELPAHLMHKLAVDRRSAGHLLRQLVAMQWLTASGTPRHPVYHPGPLRQVVRRYALAGLQEDLPWRLEFAPCFALPAHVSRMAQHAFTELLNNAVDHSGGRSVTVSMRQTPLQLQLLVSDDGLGIFERIAQSFAIADPALALLELSKGKLTSAPASHSGHGLFFTSRLADVFDIHANQSAFQCRSWERRAWQRGRPAAHGGTSVYLAITLDTPRSLDTVLCAHSADAAGQAFDRTTVPLHLLASPTAGDAVLASRADAKRVAARLALFRQAELDFHGISNVGHGFADELFRVFQRQHPALQLLPVGMAPAVAAVIAGVRAAA